MIWEYKGAPLKFQDGDFVRINPPSNSVYQLPFITGCVRGYDISDSGDGLSTAYELHRMGHNPLQCVREEFLTKIGESHRDSKRICQVCGGRQ